MFPVLSGANGPLDMQIIRQRIVDYFDLGIGEQFFIGVVCLRDEKQRGSSFGLFRRARGNRRDLGIFTLHHRRKRAALSDGRSPENAPLYFVGHSYLRRNLPRTKVSLGSPKQKPGDRVTAPQRTSVACKG